MNEFFPPTGRHLFVFGVLLFLGTGFVIWDEVQGQEGFSLSGVLDNATSVVVLSTAWSIFLVEGYDMFVESWLKQRKEEGRVEGQRELINTLLPLTEDPPAMKQMLLEFNRKLVDAEKHNGKSSER